MATNSSKAVEVRAELETWRAQRRGGDCARSILRANRCAGCASGNVGGG
jgi:hypothetical protein